MPQQLLSISSGFASGMSLSTSRAGLTARLQLYAEAARLGFPRDEFLEQQRLLGHLDGLVAQAHHQRLVAQREQARGLEADDRDAVLREWQQGVDQGPGLLPGLRDLAAGEERAAAAVVGGAPIHPVPGVGRGP